MQVGDKYNKTAHSVVLSILQLVIESIIFIMYKNQEIRMVYSPIYGALKLRYYIKFTCSQFLPQFEKKNSMIMQIVIILHNKHFCKDACIGIYYFFL